MPLRRPRATLAAVSALVVAGVAVTFGLSGCTLFAAPIDTVGKVDFTTPLAVPPLADSTVDAEGTRVFDLTGQSGESRFFDGSVTETSGYNGSYLGPTLRAADGENVRVDLHNELDETTTLHWHGMHLPAAMDGGPHQPVEPGDTWSPHWQIDQPAATLWYHPHPHGQTDTQVRRGLAGMFIVDDPAEQALPLPRNYGVDDVPVIVQDVAFAGDGSLTSSRDGFTGALGDQLLVDGTIGPFFEVTTDVVRLRLLNASAARIYDFTFADDREFAQIASDGGLLEAPVPVRDVLLSPGERAEILVRMAPGETVVLRSEKPDLGDGGGNPFDLGSGGDRFDVLQLRAASTLLSMGTVPDALVPVARIDPGTAVTEREFRLDGTEINDQEMNLDRIDAVVHSETTEIWNVQNRMDAAHSFHIHDVQFQVLSIDGAPPPPQLAGWKDTVYLRPHAQYRLIIAFGSESDAEHPYMFHCHLLRHEDKGMMGQFLVISKGTAVPDHWSLPSESAGSDTMNGMNHDH
ncbi:multicopper oxidase domain-containing protein [soil metagenome]